MLIPLRFRLPYVLVTLDGGVFQIWNRSEDHVSHVTFTCKWHVAVGQHEEQVTIRLAKCVLDSFFCHFNIYF